MGAQSKMGSEVGLKRGAVGTIQGVFQSFSYVGPAANVAILLLGTFAFALYATPLAVIIAWLIYGMWMITPYEFSKYKTNAGGYYAYAASSTKSGILGPITLFSWIGENFSGQSFGILGLSGFLFAISIVISNMMYIWILFGAAIALYMFIIPYLGIRISLNYVAITGLIETLILVVGAIIIIAKVGPGNSFLPFTIPPGDFSGLFFGILFGIVDFTGLGTVITVSEEVKEPRKKVRRSLLIAWLLAGVALIPASYALTVGWGISNIGSYSTSPDPGLIVFSKYLGPIGFILLLIFTINSYFSYGVAKTNAVSRIWYSAARDSILFPKAIAKINNKHRTPGNAMLVYIAIAFVLDIILGLKFGPVTAALILLTMAGIYIIFPHIFANTALTIFSHSELKKRGESSILKHFVVPTVSSVIGIIVIYFSVESTVSSYISALTAVNLAYLLAVIISLIWVLVIGGGLSAYYYLKKKDVLRKAGRFDAEESILEGPR